jgi:hypothetical protein
MNTAPSTDDLATLLAHWRVDAKAGRGGTLVFVTVRHEVSGPRGRALAAERGYPEAFVDALTRAGWLAAVPGGADLHQPDPVLRGRARARAAAQLLNTAALGNRSQAPG